MGEADATERLIAALRQGVDALPDVAALLLFGSHASGRARPDSDIDVAVLLAAPSAHTSRLTLLQAIVTALGEHVAADRLDLVILNDAPLALAFQVLKHGRLVACRDVVALHRFRVHTYRMHADFEPVERLMRRATRERAARLAGHG